MNPAVIKKDRVRLIQQIKPINPINMDLVGFLFEEINDHVNKLHDICFDEEPDGEAAEYHHTKILTMIEKLKATGFRGANFV